MKSTRNIFQSHRKPTINLKRMNGRGNVRQLQNYVESMVIMTDEDGTVRSVPLALYKSESSQDVCEESLIDDLQNSFLLEEVSFAEAVRRYEQRLIRAAVESCDGNRDLAIKKLGISRRTFYRKLQDE